MRPGIPFLIVLLALLGLSSTSARAEGTLAGAPLRTCVARVLPGDSWRAMMRAPARFDCRARQRSFGSGDYWVLAQRMPDDVAEHAPMVVRQASLWQHATTLYVHYADGAVAVQHADSAALSHHLDLGAIVEWRLPFRHAAMEQVMWRVDGAANIRGIVLGAAIATRDQSAAASLGIGALYAAFGGMCLALLVYNVAAWVALRHRFQLAYCAMVVALMIYALSSSGALAWLWPGIDNNDRIRINYLMLAASASAALNFARCFLEPRVFAGWLTAATRIVVAALLGSALAFALAPDAQRFLDQLYALAFVALLAIVGPVLWRAWARRSDYLWLFAIAWGLPILFGIARVAGNLNLIGWNFWLDTSTVLSMACEALLSSLAVAYRLNLLSRERDQASARELAALRLADVDPLTGLYNRRAFLREALARGGRQMLVLADIDHFKLINETLGHDGGDEVLRVIARALRTAGPPGTLVARLGGEEFALLAPDGDGLAATAVLDAVRAERMPFDVAVTVSLGSCTAPLATELDWKILYRRADTALFAAKDAGRDRARDASLIAA